MEKPANKPILRPLTGLDQQIKSTAWGFPDMGIRKGLNDIALPGHLWRIDALSKAIDSLKGRKFDPVQMLDSGDFLQDVIVGARFLRNLPSFLRHPITLEEAKTSLRRRLENREADFLSLVKRAIYENPESPYLQLLCFAGCEYGDVEEFVRQGGVEGALSTLFRNGVYLTVDEWMASCKLGGARGRSYKSHSQVVRLRHTANPLVLADRPCYAWLTSTLLLECSCPELGKPVGTSTSASATAC
jgi:hypothetical protein